MFLFRHQRFEKAFLLAVDIGAKDLFMVRKFSFENYDCNIWVTVEPL